MKAQLNCHTKKSRGGCASLAAPVTPLPLQVCLQRVLNLIVCSSCDGCILSPLLAPFWCHTGREVVVWGWNEDGQLGLGHKDNVLSPTKLHALSNRNIVQLAGGWNHSLALTGVIKRPNPFLHFLSFLLLLVVLITCELRTGDGQVYCWGSSRYKQIGELSSEDDQQQLTPCLLRGLPSTVPVVQVSCGLRHSALLTRWHLSALYSMPSAILHNHLSCHNFSFQLFIH